MPTVNFTKMEGAGNDYIYINLFTETLSKPEELAVKMSHRHFGIGADGLVLIAPSQVADLKMVMYNTDGSEAEMCGNAIRCVAKYAWEHNLVTGKKLKIETKTDVKQLWLQIKNNCVVSIKVDMGTPVLEAIKIPSTLTGDKIINYPFSFNGQTFHATLVSMGNPHFVTFVADVKPFPVKEWGPVIENSSYFPQRINVEFVQVISPTEVIQRTWERGSGETWACGTGASAVGVAGVLTGRLANRLKVHLTGGDLEIAWNGGQDSVFMNGGATEVFSGQWNL